MAINLPFYLDAADLASAVSVYLDTDLLNIAPDGYYGDGTITRQQSSGILLTSETCPSCSDCTSYEAQSTTTGTVYYNDCITDEALFMDLDSNTTFTFCARTDSVSQFGGIIFNIVGTC